MKIAALAGSLLALLVAAGAHAQSANNGRWCLSERHVGPNVNCSFQTFAQCQASKTSPQDTCSRNPRRPARRH